MCMSSTDSYPLSEKLKDFASPHAFIASGCYSGLSPVASGTTGSAAAAAAWYLLALTGALDSLAAQLFLVILVTGVGLLSTDRFLKSPLNSRINARKPGDPGVVVIDEWSGMMITLLGGLNSSLIYLGIGFFLFRLFDVLKPGPINSLQKLPGTWGVMLDDVGAGILALLCMQLLKWFYF